jgi:flagellar basal-body rod modification protein FlgD
MTPSVSSASPTAQSGSGNNPQPTTSQASVDKNMFLQLLVAQLKNQDPLNPADGTQFVTQLAQFQQLESSLNIGKDVTAIRAEMDQLAAASSATASQS